MTQCFPIYLVVRGLEFRGNGQTMDVTTMSITVITVKV